MTEQEFNKQYDAAVARGKAERLVARTDRLRFFVKTFDGRWNHLVESSIYNLLETYHKPRTILWRYLCYALKEWRNNLRWHFEFQRRIWWYRWVKGYERQAAIDKVCDMAEEEISAEESEER